MNENDRKIQSANFRKFMKKKDYNCKLEKQKNNILSKHFYWIINS